MKYMKLLSGPPGSGKSTLALEYEARGYVYINQDAQGKQGHLDLFLAAGKEGKDIIIDRLNFSKEQRDKYLIQARIHSYETEIIVLHQPYAECMKRMLSREGHPTIKDLKSATSALNMFMSRYEKPKEGEAHKLTFLYPEGEKTKIGVIDLDGTLCDISHRRHFVQTAPGIKKNWAAFFNGIPNDKVNDWCETIINGLRLAGVKIVFCSGRGEDRREVTQKWLNDNGFGGIELYMRNRQDNRQDFVAKEIILDFEILTRYKPSFMIDDRKQVVDLWRSRGFTCLQCDDGNF